MSEEKILYSEYRCHVCGRVVPADDATGMQDDGSCIACGSCYRVLTDRQDNMQVLDEATDAARDAEITQGS